MAVTGLKLTLLLLICIYQAQCNVCKMKSMQDRPVCAKGQHKDHHVFMDSNQTWDQGDQGVSDPVLVAEEPKNISSADVSHGDNWVGFSNDSVVGDVSTTTVDQDVFEPDYREGSGSEQQDPANSTFWPSAPDRGNITSMVNVTRRERVFGGCPQLSWEGAAVTITIAVCVVAILYGTTCITWDIVEWCKGDVGKPRDENQLCYHFRRVWWVCTVPRAQQRQWRVTQDRRWRERNVRQVVPAPVLGGSGLCDNDGFQQIELGVM